MNNLKIFNWNGCSDFFLPITSPSFLFDVKSSLTVLLHQGVFSKHMPYGVKRSIQVRLWSSGIFTGCLWAASSMYTFTAKVHKPGDHCYHREQAAVQRKNWTNLLPLQKVPYQRCGVFFCSLLNCFCQFHRQQESQFLAQCSIIAINSRC